MSQKHTKKTLPLGDRVIGTIWGIIILVGIGILWLYLYGSYFTILGEPAPITPLYVEGWIYASIWIFSFVGIIMTILLIVMMIRKYRGNALQLTIRSVLCQIGLYLLFLIVTPGYTIQLIPQIFGFTDLKAEYVTNTKMYFFWVDTLGYDFVKGYKFQTLDDAIEGLEFAKNRDDLMYTYIFNDLEVFGYEEVFKRYDDVILQSEFITEKLNINYGSGEFDYQKNFGDKFLNEYSKIFPIIFLNTKNENIKMVCELIIDVTLKYNNGIINKTIYFEEIRKIFIKIYEKEIILPSL